MRCAPMALGGGIVASALALQPPTQVRPSFRDIAHEAGITFVRHSAAEKDYILESMSGGVALLDFDGDGLVDIYFVDSLTVDTAADARSARSALFRNLGNLRFDDVTEKAGVAHPGWGMGVCTADVDGDGHEDIYVTGYGGNRLYRNGGDGTFTDIAGRAGVAGGGWSTGCGFADYDRDGDLDLFVSRYVKIDLRNLPEPGQTKSCHYRGLAVQCGPRGLPGESDLLFRNDGDGRFTEVGEKAGVADLAGYFGLGVAWFDQDEDGWPDLYVANDATPSFLYLNQRDGTFKEVGFAAGVAVSEDGTEQGGMGVTVGDYDNSGRLSLYKSNFADEPNNLYRNEGRHFTDTAFRSKTAASSIPYVGWGAGFLDYDNNGFLDLIVVNGHIYPQLHKARAGTALGYRQRALVYHNRGDGTFDEVAGSLGTVFTEERVGRGLAVGDLDNDGRPDVVINDLDLAPQVVHNEIAAAGNWLTVKLKGKPPNTSAIGAVVTVSHGARRQIRVVQSGTSYLSQDDMRRHFGLGAETQADSVEVRWPDGTATTRSNIKANQIVEIDQGCKGC